MGVSSSNDDNALTLNMVEVLMKHERTKTIIVQLYRHFDDLTKTDRLKLIINCKGCNVLLEPTLYYDN